MSRIRQTLIALAVGSACSGLSAGEAWHVVVADARETIALDTSRVLKTASGVTAWSRIALGREVRDPNGPYNAIEAENAYDCQNGRFTTLRRVYLRNGERVREEPAVRERANAIMPGTIDERLFAEACRDTATHALAEGGAVTGRAAAHADAIPAGAERPGAMPADMRTLGGGSGVQVLRVSDAPAPAEKPKMIELPKIDKAAAAREAAAAGVALPGAAAAKPADIHGAASAASAAAAAHGAAPAAPVVALPRVPPVAAAPIAPAKPVAKPVPMASTDLGVSGHAREIMLATSGPRKAKKNPAEEMHVHWGYDGAGAPENWGKLDSKNALCDSGKRQSPIDIRPGISVDLEPIKITYKPSKFSVADNGHTIQVNVGAGNVINVMGKRFELAQFHFHKPSEERVNGRPFPMVIHFVHKDWDDNLAVIAVLLDEGSEHGVLQTVWNHMPLEAGSEVNGAALLDVAGLFPDNKAYWTYMGSLTTPPCSENVLWMVMKNPVLVSPEQIGTFARLYKKNARPIQPSNGRLIKESR